MLLLPAVVAKFLSEFVENSAEELILSKHDPVHWNGNEDVKTYADDASVALHVTQMSTTRQWNSLLITLLIARCCRHFLTLSWAALLQHLCCCKKLEKQHKKKKSNTAQTCLFAFIVFFTYSCPSSITDKQPKNLSSNHCLSNDWRKTEKLQ